MIILKTPEELRRAPLAYALTMAMIYGLAEICFWVCVGATGVACCFALLFRRDDVRDPRMHRWLFVVLGSSSLLFYGYLSIWHPYIFGSTDPAANSGDIASFGGIPPDLFTPQIKILNVMIFVGAAPMLLIGLFMLAGFRVFKVLVNWLLTRAGRLPLF